MNMVKLVKQITLVSLLSPTLALAGNYQDAVQTHPSQGPITTIEATSAKIVSYEEGIAVNLNTQMLEPGHVYTLWFVAINKPKACANTPEFCTSTDVLKSTKTTESDVIYADGTIADENGAASFKTFIEVNNPKYFWFSGGLKKPLNAEIHLVINDHGPALPDVLHSMLTSYRGGCRDEGLPAAFPETAKSDGIPGPNTCRLVQMVRFQQH